MNDKWLQYYAIYNQNEIRKDANSGLGMIRTINVLNIVSVQLLFSLVYYLLMILRLKVFIWDTVSKNDGNNSIHKQ